MAVRLKSLELNGYKTFANRTTFEFSESITAIVGPNGSGKSNIADAIRWVLGEQSYSLLRGRKTDDMIFAGSDSRPQAGMASASLVFDNSDGWLPIDFSEVSVTRRAYRDGQNEYLINNQKVRLKDINELLANSGLSERTYTVIGQGLVDAALSLNSVERRRLFEEAAGIGIYRSRKDQSIRRLEKTRRNLERVQDILAELKPRLRSLKRQSAKAEEHAHVKKDLQEILREWYGYHWHKAQSEIKDVKELASLQERNFLKAKEDEEQVTGKLQENRESILLLREKLAGWHKDLAEKHSQRESLNRHLAVGDERERSIEEQKENLQRQILLAREEEQLKQARLEEAQQRSVQARELRDEAREMAAAAQDAFEERQSARQALEKSLDADRKTLEDLGNRQIEFQARQFSMQDAVAKYAEEAKEAEANLATAESEMKEAREEYEQLTDRVNKTRKALDEIEAAIKQGEQELGRFEKQQQDIHREINQQESTVSKLAAESEVLEKAEANLTGYSQGAKLLVEASRTKRLGGSKGLLSSLIHVPPDLEVAISAAMGEFLDSFLLDAGGDADGAIDLLLQEGARASLVPLNGLRLDEPLIPPEDQECLGVASRLVDVSSDLRSAIDSLLGQVLVVKTRAAARRLLKNADPQVKAVTLNGELFYASGAVFVDSKGGSGTISRPRRRRELEELLTSARQEMEQRKGDLEKIDTQIEEKKMAIGSLHTRRTSQREEWQQMVELQGSVSLKLEQISRRLDWERDRLAKLAAEKERSAEGLKELQRGGEALVERTAALEEAIRASDLALKDMPLDDVRSSLVHWKTQLALSETALQESDARQAELLADRDKSRENIALLRGRLDELESQSTAVSENMQQSRQQEGGLAGEIDAVQTLIIPAEDQLRNLEKDQESLLAEEAAARQVLNVAERHSSQSQIVLARQQEALEALRLRIEDDFGLVDFEYQDQVSGPTPLPLGDLVERLPMVKKLSPDIEETLKQKRSQLRRIGSVNPEAQAEYENVSERYEFLTTQVEDLTKAEKDIREVIAELDGLMDREFRKTFEVVAAEFKVNFSRLFGGGSARLLLSDGEDINDAGVDIETKLPGKRSQRLALLSGGERSLTAAALVFSLLKASPTPFCVMDEVDAMLDEANIGRFREILSEFSQQTQFVVITHNRNTVQAAEMIYGVTMGRDTASQIISLKLDDVDERFAPQGV